MRNTVMIAAAALLLASANPAQAQQPAAGTSSSTVWGSVDFGARMTSTTGDAARYERYRDLASGAATDLAVGQETATYRFDASATNVGYADQEYGAHFRNGKLKARFTWNSIPLNYSYETKTPYAGPVVSGNTVFYTIDPTVREGVQDGEFTGIPTNAAGLEGELIYDNLANAFALTQRRDVLDVGLAYDAKALGLDFGFTSTKKTGYQPFGMSFAFADGVEVPYPLDQRTDDFSVGIEWANAKGMVRVGYDASYFTNDIQTVIWDNPVWGPVDASFSNGYSTGNGASKGRLALPPDNHQNVISFTGLYKLPGRSVLNGIFSYTDQRQNGALIPFTINTAVEGPALERPTAEAGVHGYNAAFNFTSRPNRYVGFTAKYRYNKHDNVTPMFDAEEYVRFDQVLEETGGETEQFDVTRNTFDANVAFNVVRYTTLRVGYGYDKADRTGRGFSGMKDNTFRVSFDTVGNAYLTLRGIYEHTQRKGEGFSVATIEEGGAQPGLRFYDEADRDRDKGTIVVTLTPGSIFNVNLSYGNGKDTYKGEGHEFGLLDNTNTSYTVGFDVFPNDRVAFGVNYGRDEFSSTQKSRNANPPPDPSFTDPSRDWYLDNDETVNNFSLYLDVTKALEKTDLGFTYDFSDSDNAFVHYGPRIDTLAAAGQFIPLPNVTNQWQRFAVDAKHMITEKVGFGLGYWYEKFEVTDFATIDTNGPVGYNAATGTPANVYLGGLILGYGNRPYTGSTGFIRLLYLF